MRVLIACEESQTVCKAFRDKGHDAYSCDILPCSGGHPEWHIEDDVLEHLNDGWDMMIAFPPCTHLAVSGARYFDQKKKDGRQQEGVAFFMNMVEAPVERIAIENPVGIMSTVYREPDQIIQPYYFGDEYRKTTCLWLNNLSPLRHYAEDDMFHKKTHVPEGEIRNGYPAWMTAPDPTLRSKTFPGIAKAMAEQWGFVV